ncbi:MAG: PAS domain S-box protein, partial [Xanthobacteraceae bacterium]|nr:PAS domain S-box protein [Xanthobacteraceae bacterium]
TILSQLPRGLSAGKHASELQTPLGKITLHHVGLGTETGAVALITPDPATTATPQPAVAEAPEPAVVSASNIIKTTRDAENTPQATPQPQTSPREDTFGTEPTQDNQPHEELSHQAPAAPVAEKPVETTAAEEFYGEAPPLPSAGGAAIGAAAAAPFRDDTAITRRRHPLRFMWQMDAEGRFSFGSDEFARLIGAHTAAAFGRLWSEIADVLGLDPQGLVAKAIATRNTWSGIVVPWPADGGGARLPVELSGLPVYDSARQFAGYRGFGICRDLDGLTRLAARRSHDTLFGTQQFTNPPFDSPSPAMPQETGHDGYATLPAEQAAPTPENLPTVTETDRAVEPPINVVPFRGNGEQKPQSLTAVENHAFHEIARQLSARLEGEGAKNAAAPTGTHETAKPQASEPETPESEPASAAPAAPWLQPEAAPPRVQSALDAQLFDRLPIGVLIYRLDRLVYANRAFLDLIGYENLHALTEAGGLDALYVEPGTAQASTSSDGTPVVISTSHSAAANASLHAINWDGESAHALIFAAPATDTAATAQATAPAVTPSADQIQAEELATILETTAEGILVFDGLARISSCNRSAEALFGLNSGDITGRSLIDLFAPESQRGVLDYLESVKASGVASLLDHGRDVLGRAADGSTIPLSVTMGRTRPESARYFAI